MMRLISATVTTVLAFGVWQHADAQSLITILPGESIQQKVDSQPSGAAFLLKSGVHRLQGVRPKSGNSFTGESGAVMNGSKILTGWTRSGNYWVVGGQAQRGQQIGVCDADRPRCRFPEQLFINNVQLIHVDSLSKVTAGRWYFDYPSSRIFIADDPTGRLVETSVTTFAFHGSASNVRIKNLIIEKYATLAQHGAIHPKDGTIGASGSGWVVEDCDVRWNAGGGIAVAPYLRVSGSKVRYNGQIGFTGEYQRAVQSILIENTEIAFNNLAGFHGGWEAGGTKFLHTLDLVLRGNHVHDNRGPGLWCDTDNIRTTYENNIIENNSGIGIFHEVSYDAIIRNNIIRSNGTGWDVWMWGAQVLIASSPNVVVENNQVTVAATGGDGICLIQQNRGNGKYGPYLITNTRVANNSITFLGRVGSHGAGADYSAYTLFGGTNKFEGNNYYAADKSFAHFYWNGKLLNWSGFTGQGQDLAGAMLDVGQSPQPAAPVAPKITNLAATANTSGVATIKWTTDKPADRQVFYGLTSLLGLQSLKGYDFSTAHTVTLTGLALGSTYSYQAKSVDSQGLAGVSAILTFQVPAAIPTTPVVDSTKPTFSNLTATVGTNGTATITWVTNEASDGQVLYGTGGQLTQQSTRVQTSSTSHSIALSGLTAGAVYVYQARSVDSSGNIGVSAVQSFTVASATSSNPLPAPTPDEPEVPVEITRATLSAPLASAGEGVIWQMTWDTDGTQYSTYSDGRGFGGTALINAGATVTPGTPGTANGSTISAFPQVPAGQNWYGQSTLAVGGKLYYALGYLSRNGYPQQFTGSRIIFSSDQGRTWRQIEGGVEKAASLTSVSPSASNMIFWNETDLAFSQLSFLQSGPGNASAKDNYIYIYAPNGKKLETLELARVPKDRINERSAWEFFASRNGDGTANWTNQMSARGSVHSFPSGYVPGDLKMSWHPSVVYNPALKQYVMAAGGIGRNSSAALSQQTVMGIYVADEPWGPWKQVLFANPWTAGNSADRLFEPAFAPKWTSSDGKTMYLVFSGTGNQFKFNVLPVKLD